jgi:hypothetical protein
VGLVDGRLQRAGIGGRLFCRGDGGDAACGGLCPVVAGVSGGALVAVEGLLPGLGGQQGLRVAQLSAQHLAILVPLLDVLEVAACVGALAGQHRLGLGDSLLLLAGRVVVDVDLCALAGQFCCLGAVTAGQGVCGRGEAAAQRCRCVLFGGDLVGRLLLDLRLGRGGCKVGAGVGDLLLVGGRDHRALGGDEVGPDLLEFQFAPPHHRRRELLREVPVLLAGRVVTMPGVLDDGVDAGEGRGGQLRPLLDHVAGVRPLAQRGVAGLQLGGVGGGRVGQHTGVFDCLLKELFSGQVYRAGFDLAAQPSQLVGDDFNVGVVGEDVDQAVDEGAGAVVGEQPVGGALVEVHAQQELAQEVQVEVVRAQFVLPALVVVGLVGQLQAGVLLFRGRQAVEEDVAVGDFARR